MLGMQFIGNDGPVEMEALRNLYILELVGERVADKYYCLRLAKNQELLKK